MLTTPGAYVQVTQDTSRCAIANINPYRYRGYYYDPEIGMYYLQSRYYNPALGRFVNADEGKTLLLTGKTVHYNLQTYCYNNCVNLKDTTGFIAIEILSIIQMLLEVVAFILGAYLLLAIVSNPGFRQGLNQWGDEFSRNLNRGLDNLGNSINKLGVWLSSNAKRIAKALAISFAMAKVMYSSYEKHHIVAKKAPNAMLARNVLNKVGIGYESPKNYVWINKGLHRRLHTNLYYGFANSVVISAYYSAGNKKWKQRKAVIAALFSLKLFVQGLDKIYHF